jgi:ABC-type amino acid transport substrate-binding protein
MAKFKKSVLGNPAKLNRSWKKKIKTGFLLWTLVFLGLWGPFGSCVWGGDLEAVKKSGKLRHLGIPYANFVTMEKAGLDVELMKGFASSLGVKYEYVESNWQDILGDLTGKVVKPQGQDPVVTGKRPIRGDVIATGFTVLPWRTKVVNFSEMTFPTGVWLVTRGDSSLRPVVPTGDFSKDILSVKNKLSGVSVLVLKDSCLDPALYGLEKTGAVLKYFPTDQNLDDMIPAVMAKMADTTLMDVPVVLTALQRWPGEIKVVGPVSRAQEMACAFPKSSPELLRAFNDYLKNCKKDGTYRRLVAKYYPSVFVFYPEFLEEKGS